MINMTRCRICNRTLTSEVSIKVGIGPECLERAIADQPALASLRSEFGGSVRRIKTISDSRTGDLFEECENDRAGCN